MRETKLCRRCGNVLNVTLFYKRKGHGGLGAYCKECTKKQALLRQRDLKISCVEYKGGGCEICGYNKCVLALEFHHTDPSKKEFTVSKHSSTIFDDRIKGELDKCEMLCANCHREVHYDKREYSDEELRYTSKAYNVERKKSVHYCSNCGKEVYNKSTKRCKHCHSKSREIINWPSMEKLREMVADKSYREVGRILGVSDNAIRRRLGLR